MIVIATGDGWSTMAFTKMEEGALKPEVTCKFRPWCEHRVDLLFQAVL